MRFAGLLISCAVAGLAGACGQSEPTTEAATAPEPAAAPAPYARTVRVTLSPEAAARLAEMGERIVVSANWTGQPAAGSGVPVEEDGSVVVGQERVTLAGAGGEARLTGQSVDRDLERRLDGGRADLNINVFTAREAGPDNVLQCDIHDGPAVEAPDPIPIACTLIGG